MAAAGSIKLDNFRGSHCSIGEKSKGLVTLDERALPAAGAAIWSIETE